MSKLCSALGGIWKLLTVPPQVALAYIEYEEWLRQQELEMSDKFTVGAREAMLGESPSYDKRPAPHVTNTDPSLRDQLVQKMRDGSLTSDDVQKFKDSVRQKHKDDILNEREATHGDYRDMSAIAQGLKGLVRSGPSWDKLSQDQRETVEMWCTKIARIVSGNPNEPDHWRDVSGYANLVYERLVK